MQLRCMIGKEDLESFEAFFSDFASTVLSFNPTLTLTRTIKLISFSTTIRSGLAANRQSVPVRNRKRLVVTSKFWLVVLRYLQCVT